MTAAAAAAAATYRQYRVDDAGQRSVVGRTRHREDGHAPTVD